MQGGVTLAERAGIRDDETVGLALRMRGSTRELLRAKSAAEGMTMNAYVRDLIERAVGDHVTGVVKQKQTRFAKPAPPVVKAKKKRVRRKKDAPAVVETSVPDEELARAMVAEEEAEPEPEPSPLLDAWRKRQGKA